MAMTEKNKQILTATCILGGVLVVLLGYSWFYMVNPEIQENSKKVASLKTKIETNRAELAKLQAFIDDVDSRKALMDFVAEAKRRLPSTAEELEFARILSDALKRTEVRQTFLQQMDEIPRELFFEIPFQIRGAARYHEFGQFLNMIESNPDRFMRVSSFRLSNSDSRPSVHPMEATITTFRFRQ